MQREIPKPWATFLGDLDHAIQTRVELHCLGGFVIAERYGLARPTGDVDVLTAVPATSLPSLIALAGLGSPLHKKHHLYLQVVTVTQPPEDYALRLTEMFPAALRWLRLLALDPYDLALTKLERNSPRDREDVFRLAEAVPLDLAQLRTRYEQETRPYLGNPAREDLTLKLWIEAIEERRQRQKS